MNRILLGHLLTIFRINFRLFVSRSVDDLKMSLYLFRTYIRFLFSPVIKRPSLLRTCPIHDISLLQHGQLVL